MVSPSRWNSTWKSVSENTPRRPVNRSSSNRSQMVSLVKRKTDSEWLTMWCTSLGWNAAIGNGGHVGDAPAGVVFPDDGYLVASTQLAVLEQQVQTGYLLGYFAIGITLFFTIIRIAGKIPILAETMFVQFDEILLYHDMFLDDFCKIIHFLIIIRTFAR